MIIKLKFVPQDCWVGIHWSKKSIWTGLIGPDVAVALQITKVYICLLPCLPIVIGWSREVEKKLVLEEPQKS
jgi:hypothetical protein